MFRPFPSPPLYKGRRGGVIFSAVLLIASKSNPLELPLRKGERGLSPLFDLYLDNHLENYS